MKMKIVFLFLCINIAWCLKRERCEDCVPIRECKNAEPYMKETEENIHYIFQYYCGLTDSINVCCSKFKNKEHPNLRLLADPSCGKIINDMEYRIHSGNVAELYELPWMVAIFYEAEHGDETYKCSGALINSRYVLTAAHCIYRQRISSVRVGEHTIGQTMDCIQNTCEQNLQILKVEDRIIHPKYKERPHLSNDIGLLRLEKYVDMTFENTGTICLPITRELQLRSLTGKNGTVAGWGRTEFNRYSSRLLKVDVPVIPLEECQSYYSYISESEDTKICAGAVKKDSCEGDSGGPLIFKDIIEGNYKYIQYGIVSSGPSTCGKQTPGVYTDVRKYIDWILDNIKE